MIEIRAEMDANVWQVLVEVGQTVSREEEMIILESMKMEIPVEAPADGVVARLAVSPGDSVRGGQVLLVLDPA